MHRVAGHQRPVGEVVAQEVGVRLELAQVADAAGRIGEERGGGAGAVEGAHQHEAGRAVDVMVAGHQPQPVLGQAGGGQQVVEEPGRDVVVLRLAAVADVAGEEDQIDRFGAFLAAGDGAQQRPEHDVDVVDVAEHRGVEVQVGYVQPAECGHASVPVRLAELHLVTVRALDEEHARLPGVAAGRDHRALEDADAVLPQGVDHGVQVVHDEGQVVEPDAVGGVRDALGAGPQRVQLQQDAAAVQPGQRPGLERERGPDGLQSHDAGVEVVGRVEVGGLHGDAVDAQRTHRITSSCHVAWRRIARINCQVWTASCPSQG